VKKKKAIMRHWHKRLIPQIPFSVKMNMPEETCAVFRNKKKR
jgi:hypothetical protein